MFLDETKCVFFYIKIIKNVPSRISPTPFRIQGLSSWKNCICSNDTYRKLKCLDILMIVHFFIGYVRQHEEVTSNTLALWVMDIL